MQVKITKYNSQNNTYSMVNVKIYKNLQHIFELALTVLETLTFLIFDPWRVGPGCGVQFLYKLLPFHIY